MLFEAPPPPKEILSTGLHYADLGEMLSEELAPYAQRLVIPVEKRDVGDVPTEGSEDT